MANPVVGHRGVIEQGLWNDCSVISPNAVNPVGPDGNMTIITDAPPAYTGCLQADATGESCEVEWQISHAYLLGTDIVPHIHVVRNDSTNNTGTVGFQAKFRHLPMHGTSSTWTDWVDGDQTNAPADGADKTGMIEWAMASSVYTFGISDVILAIVKRVNVGAGGETGSIAVHSVDLHIQQGQFGSRSEEGL
jgi:hypothetical protein